MLSVRSRLGSLAVVLVATLGLAACTQEPADEGGDEDIVEGELPPLPLNPPSAKVPPENGVLFGAFVGVGENGTADFENQERRIGRRWVIDNRFYSTEDWTERTQWSIANKKIPLITWEPGAWKLDDIIAGTHDALFRAKAESLRDMGAEIFLRWGHEMNGNWYAWSGEQNGGAAGGPAKYIAAWRPRRLQLGHLVELLRVAELPDADRQALQRLRRQEAAHAARDLVGRGRRQQAGMDPRDAHHAQDPLHGDQGAGVVRHRQGDRLARPLHARDPRGVQGDGARPVLQSLKRGP
jgi:hypothetical protein